MNAKRSRGLLSTCQSLSRFFLGLTLSLIAGIVQGNSPTIPMATIATSPCTQVRCPAHLAHPNSKQCSCRCLYVYLWCVCVTLLHFSWLRMATPPPFPPSRCWMLVPALSNTSLRRGCDGFSLGAGGPGGQPNRRSLRSSFARRDGSSNACLLSVFCCFQSRGFDAREGCSIGPPYIRTPLKVVHGRSQTHARLLWLQMHLPCTAGHDVTPLKASLWR